MNSLQIIKLILPSWPIFLIIFIIAIVYFILDLQSKKHEINKNEFSEYERKPFLFDTTSELKFYKILLELFGDKYHIFTQINYSHLVRPKYSNRWEERRYRSKIDRKSADFVLCDKEHVIPVLVIELDGSAHTLHNKQERDEFINNLLKTINLPIIHIKNSDLENKEFIRLGINNKLIKN